MQYAKYIIYTFILITISSCSSDDDSWEQDGTNNHLLKDAKIEIIEGNGQSGYLGDKLNNEIIIKASANIARKYLLTYEVIKGEGTIILGDYYDTISGMHIPDKKDEFRFSWNLGCNDIEQKVKITLYTDSIKSDGDSYIYHKRPSYELIISASATKPKGWAKACGCEYIDNYYSKIVSFDNKTLYLVGRGILYSVDGGINWKKPEFIPNNEDVNNIAFNSKGWAYITTKNGVSYSKNMRDWIPINNGFLDYRDPTSFYVDDEILLISFYFDGIYMSTNNGSFWRKLLVGDPPNQFISRHPNGDLYFWDKWTSCYRSSDLGQTWSRVNINYKYVHSEIEDFKIDKNGWLYIGSGDATISIIDPITYEGDVHRYYEWNAVYQTISNITITSEDVLYMVNGHPKKGIYSKKNNWQYLDLNFPYTISNYYLKPDNTYILFSEKGVFYFSEKYP